MATRLNSQPRAIPGSDSHSDPQLASGRAASVIRLVSTIVILAAALTILRSLPMEQGMSAAKGWIAGLGWRGLIVFVFLYIVATILFVPGTVLTLSAGAIFGLARGTAVVSVGSTIGAALAFLIARYGARNKVAALAGNNPKFGAIDRAIGEGGWKIVGLMRLSPAIPFNLQNYLYGVTPIRFWPYVIASWVAMLPGTFLYVYLGHATGAAVGADRQRSAAEWGMLGLGLLATLVVTVYVTRLAKSKLQLQAEQTDEDAEIEPAVKPNGASSQSTQGIRTVVISCVAVAMVVAAFGVRANAAEIEKRIIALFGPPRVETREAYSAAPQGATVDHSAFDELLKQHVDGDGWVDYESLKANEMTLDAYLDSIAPSPFSDLGRDEKLALLINSYNASTLKLILDNYPVDSIMDIPKTERWDAARWNIGGTLWSLSEIEHEQIRPKFADPRIHFALVCAAVGCPPLRNEAYDAERLEEQLNSQAEYVHQHGTWFEFDPNTSDLKLTKLYNWYGGDFEQAAGSATTFAARYSTALEQALRIRSVAPSFLPYDWSLNSQQNKQPR